LLFSDRGEVKKAGYEGSVKLLFDAHDHPLSQEQYRKMSDDQKSGCPWRRCYKMVTLLHTNSALDFFLFEAVRVVAGNDHECPVLYALVEEFVQAVGKGQEEGTKKSDRPRGRPRVIAKREKARQKTLHQLKHQQPPSPPEKVLIKKEAAAIGEFRRWSSCTVPLSVVANREHYGDGHQDLWFLIDTRQAKKPDQFQQEYPLRVSAEERYRQLKCFSDLTRFTSRAFSMVVNQVLFIMLAYNLLQIYLLHRGRKELNQKTLPHIRQQLFPSDNHILVYYQNYYGLFAPFELIGFVVAPHEQARIQIAGTCRRIGRELNGAMHNPRPP
jgi:hypothetical protein